MSADRAYQLGWLRFKQSLTPLFMVCAILCANVTLAERPLNVFDDQAMSKPFEGAQFSDPLSGSEEYYSDQAAEFDEWETLVEPRHELATEVNWDDPRLKPFDWIRHLGFRHSSTHGRHIGRGLPMEGTSWKNRPYHVDWFSGTLIGDDLIAGRVSQDNELFGGLRIGWDFDYYWGIEARFGWSRPNATLDNQPLPVANNASYFVSDVDFIYYPWGDSKIRPYMLAGVGMARISFADETPRSFNTTLATVPLGGGVQFRQTPWMVWRLEVLDNLSFGADGVDTMHNLSLTAGMEFRFGSRPASYWPWRSSRSVW